ncbi:GIY-YIG nuclease family protein [Rathayibacter sp. VKM Ac-2801]|uniref:GIY-YIG nuclease family protein n=1 Tax=Rathayibacter sp. VKM Ac-2801 TaxID=2609255 RepID=UPI00131F5561|nr:hypothetical protein [Rathayibacter sp. VKM Ac-2801]QHC70474.1 hypothetical protein GSU45_08905 [Rathayibacter sp. VKM Ac-2801]
MDLDSQLAALMVRDRTSLEELLTAHASGLYAWWDPFGALDGRWPEGFPVVGQDVPLYVGIARTSLAVRGGQMHLKKTRMSTLRRSLVGLLLDELDLSSYILPSGGTKFGLRPDGESVLIDWMVEHLRVSSVAVPHPGEHERAIVSRLHPPLNDVFAHDGPYGSAMRAVRATALARISAAPRA